MRWKPLRIREIARQINRKISVDPNRSYKLLGMRSKIGGPFIRESKMGSEISASVLNEVRAGDFIYSRLFAWQGSFGVVPQEFDGAFVSNEFPIFEIDVMQADAYFLVYLFGLPSQQRAVEMDCFGSTPGTRNRYKEEYFLNFLISLPPLEEQRRIVAKLERVATLVGERQRIIKAAECESRVLLLKAFDRVIEGAPYRPMAEVAPLVRRPVEVQPDQSYLELGVRSFGHGTFHKRALEGTEVGLKKLFRIRNGDLLFNTVFAWEGAVAVARETDDGRVGSHRFLTCLSNPGIITNNFLRFYFLTPEGLRKLGEASPGGAGRNRTLGLKKLAAIEVSVPPLEQQRWFDRLQHQVHEIEAIHKLTNQDTNSLIPALLHRELGVKFLI